MFDIRIVLMTATGVGEDGEGTLGVKNSRRANDGAHQGRDEGEDPASTGFCFFRESFIKRSERCSGLIVWWGFAC